ncbi:hypothetical protein M3Y97_00071800 [Aphelenchoides bicaudatus]|nr:hypothetical protein M3Y97_00071800 [Aphelenchoides bicaudatus]
MESMLRCDVENKDCGIKYVIAAKPIFPPIHTRCIFKYNDAELLFFGKLKFDDQSKKFKCSFLGDLTPTFPNCSKNTEVFAEYMLNTEGKLEVKKAFEGCRKNEDIQKFLLAYRTFYCSNSRQYYEQQKALKTSPIKQSEKTTPVKQPKTSVFGNESSNLKTSPVKQPSVFNIDSKTSPIKQPSVFNVDSKTTPVKQINGSSVFTESSASSKTSSIKQDGTQSMFENNCLPKTALSHQQAEQKPQMKQGFVKKAPLIKPNGTSNSDKQPESSNQVEQTSAKMNKISISSNKISLMAFSEQPKQSSAFNTHHEPEDLHAPKLPGESVFGSSFQQVSRDEVIRRPGPRPVPTRGGLYFPVVRANGRSRMLHGQRIEQVETEIKKSSSEESGVMNPNKRERGHVVSVTDDYVLVYLKNSPTKELLLEPSPEHAGNLTLGYEIEFYLPENFEAGVIYSPQELGVGLFQEDHKFKGLENPTKWSQVGFTTNAIFTTYESDDLFLRDPSVLATGYSSTFGRFIVQDTFEDKQIEFERGKLYSCIVKRFPKKISRSKLNQWGTVLVCEKVLSIKENEYDLTNKLQEECPWSQNLEPVKPPSKSLTREYFTDLVPGLVCGIKLWDEENGIFQKCSVNSKFLNKTSSVKEVAPGFIEAVFDVKLFRVEKNILPDPWTIYGDTKHLGKVLIPENKNLPPMGQIVKIRAMFMNKPIEEYCWVFNEFLGKVDPKAYLEEKSHSILNEQKQPEKEPKAVSPVEQTSSSKIDAKASTSKSQTVEKSTLPVSNQNFDDNVVVSARLEREYDTQPKLSNSEDDMDKSDDEEDTFATHSNDDESVQNNANELETKEIPPQKANERPSFDPDDSISNSTDEDSDAAPGKYGFGEECASGDYDGENDEFAEKQAIGIGDDDPVGAFVSEHNYDSFGSNDGQSEESDQHRVEDQVATSANDFSPED